MKVTIVAVGKLKTAAYRELCDDYMSRIRRYVRCDELEVKDAAGLARAFDGEAWVVALEVHGDAPTSEGFSRALQTWGSRGKGEIAFMIGGAEGIPAELSARAAFRLSLSQMTLPHRLARVLLAEQIYRALTISRGEPYAREG